MAGMATVTPITKNPRAERARSNSENLTGFARDLIEAGYTPESVSAMDPSHAGTPRASCNGFWTAGPPVSKPRLR